MFVIDQRTLPHCLTITRLDGVAQRMRWREFQVVPSRESAIECLRVYYTLGETVIQLAADALGFGLELLIARAAVAVADDAADTLR